MRWLLWEWELNGNLAMYIGSSCPRFPGRIGIWNVGFCEGSKTPRARTMTNDKLNPHMKPGPGKKKPGPEWWEANTLTTIKCELLI